MTVLAHSPQLVDNIHRSMFCGILAILQFCFSQKFTGYFDFGLPRAPCFLVHYVEAGLHHLTAFDNF